MSGKQFSPYVGLRPFKAEENLLFFGRDAQTLELLQRLHKHRFVAVVGGSGSGKSSLIRAGLIPALKGGYLIEDSRKWMVYTMKPGQNAMFNLAKSILFQINSEVTTSEINELVLQIKREGVTAILNRLQPLKKEQSTNFFLLVDQFEELFRSTSEQHRVAKKTDAIDFVNTILSLTRQKALSFYVVLTMRSDFIGDCAQFRDLPEAMNKSQYLVPRLSRQQLKTVIEGPSKLYGKKFDPTLTSRLINDLEKVKDELPLVQHALMRMWNHEVNVHKNGMLDLEDYEAVGGIENALSKHAEEAIVDMDDRDIAIAKELFQALTAVDENGRKIRRRLLLSDLQALTGASEEKLKDIINKFIKDQRSFLIAASTSDGKDQVIDISHESLIRQWDTLRQWVDEEAESSSSYLQLAKNRGLKATGKKDYLTGTELQIALNWRNNFKPTAVWANRYKSGFQENMAYLEASHQEHIRLENIKKSKRKRQFRATVFITLLIVSSAIYAIFAGIKAKSQEAETSNIKSAFQLHFHATVVESKDPTSAVRLEQEALKLYNYSGFEEFAMEMVNNHPLYRTLARDSAGASAIAVSPSGKFLLFGNEKGTIRLWDHQGNVLHTYEAHESAVTSLKFAPDESTFISSSLDSTVKEWDTHSGNLVRNSSVDQPVTQIEYTRKGALVTADRRGTISFWKSDGNIRKSFKAHNAEISALAFSNDGNMMLSGSKDRTAKLWNMEGDSLHQFTERRGQIYTVAFSPDSKLVLTGNWDSTARLYDLEGNQKTHFKGHWGAILSVAFSPDGEQILTGSFDNTMRSWDLEGNLIDEFRGHDGEIRSVSFADNGKTILSGSRDGTVRTWFRNGIKKVEIEQDKAIRSIRYAPNNETFLTGTQGKAQLWDREGVLLREYPGDKTKMVFSAVYSPDGQHIVTSSLDGIVRFWEFGGKQVWEKDYVLNRDRAAINQGKAAVRAIAFAPDGQSFVTGSWDFMIRIWNLDGSIQKEYKHDKGITSVAFAPDGKSVVGGSFGKSLLWNLEKDTVTEIIEPNKLFVNGVAFTPDGSQILTGSQDEGARLWDLNGQLVQEFKGPIGAVRSVAISHDGKSILTGTDGGTARLWGLDANILAEHRNDRGSVFSVTFGWDNRTLMMTSGDKIYNLKIIQLDEFLAQTPIEPLSKKQKKDFNLTD
ncbi:MAG: WD40 repeat domain-containing protein [Bacteroidota bacterium]